MTDYTLPPVPDHPEPRHMRWSELELKAIDKHGHACAEHVRAPLIKALAQCFNLGGSDAGGNGDEWRAANAVRSVRQLREDYDEACDEGEKLRARIAELEAELERYKLDPISPIGVALIDRLRAEVEAKDAANAALRGFAQKAMEAWPECGLDGFELEDYAKEFGLIKSTRVEGPCGEDCACLAACADWPTDCYHRTALLTGSGHWVNPLAAEVEKLRADKDRIDEVQNQSLRIEPFEVRTPGGDDADVGWRIFTHHQQAPHLREVACHYADDVRTAIDAAIAARKQAEGGKGEGVEGA